MVTLGKRNLRWADLDMPDLDLANLTRHYSYSKKAEGRSPKTVSFYEQTNTAFMKFLASIGKKAVLGEFGIDNVREFIVRQQERGMSPFTVQTRVRGLKSFGSWLASEGYAPANHLGTLKLPKTPTRIVQPLTEQEIDALVNCQNPLTALGCRNIAILTALLDTGLRLSELSGLPLEDAHIDEGYLKVFGKGGKERIVPLGSLARKAIWRYMFHFRPPPVPSENFVFLTLDGRRLSSDAIKLVLDRWGKRAGVPRLHAHLCRHTYATNFLTYECGDVFRLQQILGHSTLQMVGRYVHYSSTQAMLHGRVSSPLDHLGLKKLTGYKIDRALGRSTR